MWKGFGTGSHRGLRLFQRLERFRLRAFGKRFSEAAFAGDPLVDLALQGRNLGPFPTPVYRAYACTCRSFPCSSSEVLVTSVTLVAVTTAVCTKPLSRSAPM